MGSRLIHCVCLMFLLVSSITKVRSQRRVFNVKRYGAVADGVTDSSKALAIAWYLACQSIGGGVVLIPKGSFLVNPVAFKGTCKGQMSFIIGGDLKAPTDQQYWANIDHWITFQYVDNLIISGGGSLDGQGPSAWSHNTCSRDTNCVQLPISLRLDFVTRSWIHHIRLINSKNFHMNIFSCDHIKIDHIGITAPGDSPNTDGIHIASSTNLEIADSVISTGDDCISIGPGTKDLVISGVQCGPGHGISIGSLGKYPNEEKVAGCLVRNCTLIGTQNGVRIKTWAPSGPGNVFNLTFEQINMVNVYNPIIIDQNYCPSGRCAHSGSSQIEIRNVKFRNIWGTSRTKVAVDLECSQSRPCQEIELRDISLTYEGAEGPATSQCSNAKGIAYGHQQPRSCL